MTTHLTTSTAATSHQVSEASSVSTSSTRNTNNSASPSDSTTARVTYCGWRHNEKSSSEMERLTHLRSFTMSQFDNLTISQSHNLTTSRLMGFHNYQKPKLARLSDCRTSQPTRLRLSTIVEHRNAKPSQPAGRSTACERRGLSNCLDSTISQSHNSTIRWIRETELRVEQDQSFSFLWARDV